MTYYLIYRNDKLIQINEDAEVALADLELYQKQDDKPSMVPPSNYYLKVFIKK